MKIGQILLEQQPDVHKKLNKNKSKSEKERKPKKEHLSFSDYRKMMQHDSYRRGKGGSIRQVRHT